MSIFGTSVVAAAVPLLYLIAAGATRFGSVERRWAGTEVLALVALAVAAGAAVHGSWSAWQGVAADGVGLAMSLLIAILGWVIVRYSRRYLAGESRQERYLTAMLLTLGAVSVVAVTGHLVVLLAAWIASSLGLHVLLTFYDDRAPALIVAHKKFLASRLAELCMAVALVLIYREAGTLSIAGVAAHVEALTTLSAGLQAAALLAALGVILKSAQLPVHGWLIQVMEAPTPVSALLHAGIVNLGGFILIRLAMLLSVAPAAQTLLVIVGSLTAVLAGLVMMTRISIKVRLAWSTAAQMGFMIMECGLGLYDLAFLHLMAHSLYKAYAFLSAGETVQDTRRRQLLPADVEGQERGRLVLRLLAAPVALAVVALSVLAWQAVLPTLVMPVAVVLILGLGLAPLLWREEAGRVVPVLRGLLAVAALTQLYLVWHLAFGRLVGLPAHAESFFALCWVAVCFAALYVTQAWLLAFPRGVLSQKLYPWAYAGFYLDERFTRLTFRVWPARLPKTSPRRLALRPMARLSGEQA